MGGRGVRDVLVPLCDIHRTRLGERQVQSRSGDSEKSRIAKFEGIKGICTLSPNAEAEKANQNQDIDLFISCPSSHRLRTSPKPAAHTQTPPKDKPKTQ